MNAFEFFRRYSEMVTSGKVVNSIDDIIQPDDNVKEVEI